ncbi:decapping 1 [Wolffia australiana]
MSRQGNGVGNGGGKLTPNLDKNSTKALNLTVLQRIDPFVEEILITAAHVTLYEFNIELNQWSRKDVEGSLFVVKRNSQPRFQFIVMNRRNTENLIEDILGDFEFEVQVPYLLYRNAAQEVNGIWFYNSQECEAVANLFNRILGAFSKVPPKPNVAGSKSEFEELEAVPSLSVIEGPLEPMVSSSTSAPDVPDDSFLNFFTAAAAVGNNVPVSAQPLQTSPPPASISPLTPAVISSSAQPANPSLPLSAPSLFDAPEPAGGSAAPIGHLSNLVKPSYFTPQPSSSGIVVLPVAAGPLAPAVAAPPLHVPLTLQRPYGAPLLQPFPPPNPSVSLTPPATYGAVITRDKVRDALTRLVQNDQFIDMVYREMLNSHSL